jgi:glyoxylase-like metal-dependent hydrolase (beta-lactamase superfamily II)
MTLGDLEVTPLLDGYFRLDGGAMFGVVPKPLWERRAPADDRNRITLGLRPLLVRAQGRVVLIDAGIGGKMGPKETDIYGIDRAHHIEHSLAGAGLSPADVTHVVATHLHFDHIGGATKREGDRVVPAFPNARYLVRRQEWEDATHTHERNRASYIPDDFMPLEAAGVIDWVDQDGEVLPGISVWVTGGHCRHHQVVRLESRGQVGVFTADLLPTTAHLDEAWIMGYDLYPMDTLMYKKRFLAEAIERRYVIFFEHDPAVAAGIITVDGRRKAVEPLA